MILEVFSTLMILWFSQYLFNLVFSFCQAVLGVEGAESAWGEQVLSHAQQAGKGM